MLNNNVFLDLIKTIHIKFLKIAEKYENTWDSRLVSKGDELLVSNATSLTNSTLCAERYPNPVIYRREDFRPARSKLHVSPFYSNNI